MSCYNMPIIKQLAELMGLIMNLLFNMFDKMGIVSIGLCIIVFTIIVKMLMLPLTIKQQKFSKVSAVMQPELQALQKKYQNRRDPDAMQQMQIEQKALYEKYGVSQTGSCLQLLIQMPIIFALYAVVAMMPKYVDSIQNFYTNDAETGVVDIVESDYSQIKELASVVEIVDSSKDFSSVTDFIGNENYDTEDELFNRIVTSTYSEETWDAIIDLYSADDGVIALVTYLSEVSDETWDELISVQTEESTISLLETYKDNNYSEILSTLQVSADDVDSLREEISDLYSFFGIDLSISPNKSLKSGVWWALLIPILSALSQWASITLTSRANKTNNNASDNPMAQSMKMMNITMPLISAFFCFTLPAGLGLYWIIQAVITCIQQICINKYFEKEGIDRIIEKGVEAQKKKREKRGIVDGQISQVAGTNAKTINSSYKSIADKANVNKNIKDIPDVEDSATSEGDIKTETSSGNSISSRANMVKKFNEKNK